MGTYRFSSTRYVWLSLSLIMLGTAAATEVYKEAPADLIENDLDGQEQNSIESSLTNLAPELTAKDLYIYKLIRSLQNLHPEAELDYIERSSHHLHRPSMDMDKEKRLTDLMKGSRYRPQQQWKTKKGKVIGSQMVCFFKLCTFRTPS